jgi:hypothetical protein
MVVGGELAATEQSSLVVDRGRVVSVLVGVDATDDGDGSLAHSLLRLSCWIRSSVRAVLTDRGEPAGRTTGL